MKTAIALVVGVLGPALLVALVAGAALGLVIGILLLVDSERVLRWNAYMNRWISTGNAFSVLDRPRDIKRLVYHWHRVVGLLVVAGALYSVSVLAFGFGTEPLVRSFRDLASPTTLRLTVDSLKIFLIAGNVAAILAGLILCFRPSLLKEGGLGRPAIWRTPGEPQPGRTALPAGRIRPRACPAGGSACDTRQPVCPGQLGRDLAALVTIDCK